MSDTPQPWYPWGVRYRRDDDRELHTLMLDEDSARTAVKYRVPSNGGEHVLVHFVDGQWEEVTETEGESS